MMISFDEEGVPVRRVPPARQILKVSFGEG
jgi:hypothetical protein